jgi:hypothetical protein
VLDRLEGVEQTSSGYLAHCPAHDDSTPSLSVTVEDDRVLVHCHAGCTPDEVIHAIDLEWRDLFVDDPDPSWKPWEGTEVDAYSYVDEDGNPEFEVVRYEMRDRSHPAFGEKKFLQRAHAPDDPEAGTKGCPENYVWGRRETQPVLYNLPEVVSAVKDGETIYYVEGEKDVQTLADRGIAATCNPGGAAKGEDSGNKLTREMIQPLEGGDVVILPDQDEPGRQFAQAVAKRVYPKAERVRIVDLPDLKEGEDVTDFLDSGHDVEELKELVEDTEPFEPPPETVDDLVERAQQEEDPAVVYDHIRLLAEASEAEYQQARGKLKAATGINLNGLESARQEALDRIDEEKRKQKWEEAEGQDLPVIRLGDDRPSREIVEEAVEAFEDYNDPPRQFSRGGEQVRVTTNEKGRPVFETVEEPLFDDQLSRAATFVRQTRDGFVYTDPTMRLVRRVRQNLDLPPLKAVSEVPFLRPDGTVVRTPGYDEETHILYRPNPDIDVPVVPTAPTESEVERAVEIITEPFQDFPFVDEASRANLLATVFTPIVKPLLDRANVPIAIFDATKQGTGKTLLADSVSLATIGRIPASMNAPSSNEEWRKQITAQLRRGESIIVIDNVKGRLSSSALERASTTHVWGDRLLGHSKQLKLPSDALWIATGNNLRPSGEMTRRCILVRMDAEMVHPWQRTDFEHPNLREWVRSRRGRLVAAILTIVRSWIDAGRPSAEVQTLGSFEKWATVVGGVLQHLGISGFLGNLDELYETSSQEEHEWSQLLEALYEWTTENGKLHSFTARELSDDLRRHADGRIAAESDELETIRDHLPEDLRERLRYGEPIARSLGKAIGYREGRRFPGGWYVERTRRDRDGVHWRARRDDSAEEPRDNVSLDSADPGDPDTPTPSEAEGGGSRDHGTGQPKSQHHGQADEAPF